MEAIGSETSALPVSVWERRPEPLATRGGATPGRTSGRGSRQVAGTEVIRLGPYRVSLYHASGGWDLGRGHTRPDTGPWEPAGGRDRGYRAGVSPSLVSCLSWLGHVYLGQAVSSGL
ncbi:hypothetical protein Bbelb_165630 [Branchiostoma belcheri]|nr:hypothetical protein Bbelb_165630 [Branchiostoma belcheri]